MTGTDHYAYSQVELDDKGPVSDLSSNIEVHDPKPALLPLFKKSAVICPLGSLIVYILFSIVIAGVILGIQINDQTYPEGVVITAYPSVISASNNASNVFQSCYYPPISQNFTDSVLCPTEANDPRTFYCPPNYACINDAANFPAPYFGCLSLSFTCPSISSCSSEINDLPDNGDPTSKFMVFPVVSSTFKGIYYSFIVISIIVLSVVAILYHFRSKDLPHSILSSINLKVLTVIVFSAFIVCVCINMTLAIIFNGNYTFSYTDCYAEQEFNDYLLHMSTLSLVLVECAGMFPFGFYAILMVILVTYSFKKVRAMREWQERNNPSSSAGQML